MPLCRACLLGLTLWAAHAAPPAAQGEDAPALAAQVADSVQARLLTLRVDQPFPEEELARREAALPAPAREKGKQELSRARSLAGGFNELRRRCFAPDAQALESSVRKLASGLGLDEPRTRELVRSYLALQSASAGEGIRPSTRGAGLVGRDGRPVSDAQWSSLVSKTGGARARLKTALKDPFGPAAPGPRDIGSSVAAGAGAAGDRAAGLDAYRRTSSYLGPSLKQAAPPKPSAAPAADPALPPGVPPGTRLTPAQARSVRGATDALEGVLSDEGLRSYVGATDRKQILEAWAGALAKHTSPDGKVDYPGTVNAFQNTLLNGREAGKVTRTAEHWGEITAGTYNLGSWAGPPAAIGASLLWNTFSVTKSQLVRSYNYLAGNTRVLPPAGNYWGETMNRSLVTESAAAGWASTLPNPHKVNILAGTSRTLKLDEARAAVREDGIGKVLGDAKDRYFPTR